MGKKGEWAQLKQALEVICFNYDAQTPALKQCIKTLKQVFNKRLCVIVIIL